MTNFLTGEIVGLYLSSLFSPPSAIIRSPLQIYSRDNFSASRLLHPRAAKMAADWLLIATIVVILAYLGKIKVPGNVRLDDRYDLNRARFHGPGRNARQQNLAEERKERRTRHEEEVVLGNVGGEGGAEKGEGIGEIEGGGKGDFVEHPGLARGVRDVRFPLSISLFQYADYCFLVSLIPLFIFSYPPPPSLSISQIA